MGAVKRLQGNLKLSISDGGKGFHATFDSVTRKTKRCTNKHGNKYGKPCAAKVNYEPSFAEIGMVKRVCWQSEKRRASFLVKYALLKHVLTT